MTVAMAYIPLRINVVHSTPSHSLLNALKFYISITLRQSSHVHQKQPSEQLEQVGSLVLTKFG